MSTDSRSPSALLLEVCVDNLTSAIEAEKGGAKRIELCSALSEGGLTPSYGFLKIVKETIKIPVFTMIRPRGGDFLYSPEEIEIMKEDIKLFKDLADGFVFGCLDENRKIDENSCLDLVKICGKKPITFHRAFDLTSDEPRKALETIIKLGFTRLLTSGQQNTAASGKATIRDLINVSQGRIIIMPGAGITTDNVKEIIEYTGASEFHGSARKTIVSSMYSDSSEVPHNVSMGTSGKDDTLQVTDAKIVAAMLQEASWAVYKETV